VDALCTVTSTPVTVNETPLPTAGITNTDLDFCINIPETIDAIAPTPPATTFDTYSWTTGSITGANSSQWNFPTNAAGTFNCQLVVTENGCDSDPLDFEVTVFDNPVVAINPAGPINLCPTDEVILSSVNNHQTYEWFLDGVTYANSPTINISYNLATEAYLTVTSNGCSATSAVVDLVPHTVATLATWTPPPYAIDNTLKTCLLEFPIAASVLPGNAYIQWYLDGNVLPGETGPSINAQQDGDYYYSAYTNTAGFCPIYSDTIAVDLEVDMAIEIAASKDTACEGEIVQLIPEGEFVNYSWQGGIVADTLSVTNSGTYVVTGHLVSCSANDTITVFFSPYPQVNAGEDFYSDCEDFTQLFGRTDGDESYWEIDGIEAGLGDTITIETPRRTSDLVLISSLNGCESRDTVNMKVDCIYIFAPTAITPDGDGLNDVFRVYANGLSTYTLRIFNRFGQVVFETSNPDEVWTGGFNDYFLPNGVYTWQIEALDYNQQEALSKAGSKGSILVIR
jgi:gliding motility-associated-like protein